MSDSLPALKVALRKESVDRNLCSIGKYGSQAGVALRKESVDRNTTPSIEMPKITQSLSARRAWIEIPRDADGAYLVNSSRSPQGERG